jgi:NAD(P)-dependent dehydrogenase (short-subunit alcohol dehydrogenase family)
VNLAAELRGTGVTVHAYRPGRVDTAMQAWIRQQNPDRIGTGLHEQFTSIKTEIETLIFATMGTIASDGGCLLRRKRR